MKQAQDVFQYKDENTIFFDVVTLRPKTGSNWSPFYFSLTEKGIWYKMKQNTLFNTNPDFKNEVFIPYIQIAQVELVHYLYISGVRFYFKDNDISFPRIGNIWTAIKDLQKQEPKYIFWTNEAKIIIEIINKHINIVE